MVYAHPSSLSTLPAEIIYQILTFLPPLSLVSLSRTSKLFRAHALTDSLWSRFVRENVPHQPDLDYRPAQNWRDLYTSLHPYWFLARHKIWFADKAYAGNTMTGALAIVRYDPRRQCLEGLRLVARHGVHSFESWDWNPEVIIHTFNPVVMLWPDDPILKINRGCYSERKSTSDELLMDTGHSRGVKSTISLCRGLPPHLQDSAMALWPPPIIPVRERVRNESPHLFRSEGHRPSCLSDASEDAFRIRKWVEFGGMGTPLGVHIGEDVMTFSTVPEEYYTATKEKPWQGIWVGDYSGHGCEFLLLIQRAVDLSSGPPKSSLESALQHHLVGTSTNSHLTLPVAEGEDGSCAGRLEAIKLTGDPNVPRGEYTWVAEDIGPGGLLRIADERIFKGARVVRSLGHSAARGFRNDKFIPSQLIMVDKNTLAQYWEDPRLRSATFNNQLNKQDGLRFRGHDLDCSVIWDSLWTCGHGEEIVGIILASILVLVALYTLLITLRSHHSNPKYIPTTFLKNRWRSWKPKTMKYRMFGFDPISPLYNRPANRGDGSAADDADNTATAEMTTTENDGVNRNTSVRSIMTLPPYRPSPLPTERLIAREGERAGVDTVIEFPETAEEEEARREADMEELYQVRVARRQELAERRERRHARRAAREAGDWARMEQLRVQARMAENARRADTGSGSAGSSSTSLPRDGGSAGMLAEHQSRASSREGRVSSVSYADLGLARHDGSRIRADSVESDHRPLLDSAASMGGSRRGSFFNVRSGQHGRNASAGSVLTTDSDSPPIDTPYTSNRSGSDPLALTPSATHGSSGSERDNSLPAEDPPQYEDEEVPPYASPVRKSAPQLPPIRSVPDIEVEGATPLSTVPNTPVERHEGGR
ncbi:MAG: hypothetical protein LQ338_001211 [Usnochroma carphineum]|nr:MAG: hypothetical protein LQ338_001211 [Usnochroma carphineum]